MIRNRLQNKVSGSVFTLPVCAVVALVLWFLPWFQKGEHTLGFLEGWGKDGIIDYLVATLVLLVTTCILMELNNRNVLLRIRSRMVSSVWLIAIASVFIPHGFTVSLIVTLCATAAYYLLFCTYQQRDSVISAFHYALFLGVGSILEPHLLVFLPMFLWHQIAFLRSISLRSFCAVLVGCLFPLCLWGGYWVLRDDYTAILVWWDRLVTYYELDPDTYLGLSLQQVASWGLISLLSIVSLIHYLSTSYNDKIQVRMLLYILVVQFVVVDAYMALQPQHLDAAMPLLVLTGAPLIAHFFALTGSWFTNALFVLSVLLFGALIYLNYFMETIPLSDIL